ncbi:hypothetical protein DPMN_131259 [Dreissena polymorpha]|uniref:Uncharacterized protein n=1 Tax=Dreissena polymorpha TaxID=45954 RepID=A0A9D4JZW5_DREPO|nr:hypothetical protein DPMN_131259 [Dreissena polymorpha]
MVVGKCSRVRKQASCMAHKRSHEKILFLRPGITINAEGTPDGFLTAVSTADRRAGSYRELGPKHTVSQ